MVTAAEVSTVSKRLEILASQQGPVAESARVALEDYKAQRITADAFVAAAGQLGVKYRGDEGRALASQVARLSRVAPTASGILTEPQRRLEDGVLAAVRARRQAGAEFDRGEVFSKLKLEGLAADVQGENIAVS